MPSKYQPLLDFLATVTDDAVALTYKEVAAPIIGPLPESAILRTSWWTSRVLAHVRTWRAMRWRAHASASGQRVRFTRDVEEG